MQRETEATLADPPQERVGRLDGRRALVTGAGSGIGREISRLFQSENARVALLDRNVPAIEALAEEIGGPAIHCDVSDEASVDIAVDAAADELDGLDIVVSNAGVAGQGAIGDVEMTDFRQSFEINFFGHQRVSQAALRVFRRQGRGGTILYNISNQSVNPGKEFGIYGIPKAATLALMRQYAVDHGAEGLRVNGVNAGRIRSGLMTEDMITKRAHARGLTPAEYMGGNLLGREVTARDVALAFLNLALMDKVNAAVLTVDGGAVATAMR